MELNLQTIALGFVLLCAWFGFQQFSNWLVRRFSPGHTKAMESHKLFMAGMDLLKDSDANPSNLRAAIKQFDAAAEIDPADVSILLIKAVTLEQMDDINGCLKVLNVILQDESKYQMDKQVRSDAHLKRGYLLLAKKKRPDTAMGDFERALRLAPQSGRAHFMVGQALEAKHSFQKAAESYQQAIALDGTLDEAREALAGLPYQAAQAGR
eukprot:jgi/Mesen1/1883/ME000143S00935